MNKLLTKFFLILSILCFHGPFSNFVLCFGEDGHVEIEESACLHPDLKANPDSAILEVQDDCRPCEDVPVLVNGSIQYAGSLKFKGLPVGGLYLVKVPVFQNSFTKLSEKFNYFSVHSISTSLHTAVLRI